MSCVVGLVRDGCVWIGADSAATTDEGLQYICKQGKVFCKGTALIGATGSTRLMNLLELEPAPEFADDISLVVGWMRKIVEDEGSEDEDFVLSCLVGLDGKLFVVAVDCGVIEPMQGYWAIGSGGNFALGAMSVLVGRGKPLAAVIPLPEPLDAEFIIRTALSVSAQHCATVRPPFVVECL